VDDAIDFGRTRQRIGKSIPAVAGTSQNGEHRTGWMSITPIAMKCGEGDMEPMHLKEVEKAEGGSYGNTIREAQAAGFPVPQIMRLFAYKPDRNAHLSRFVHEVMRGPSPLSPGQRELIAAFTSRGNECGY
jgi:hypothetical protein